MKLVQDFGVRALLGTIAGIGFYAILILVLVRYELDIATVIALVGLAVSPWMAAIGFYFGQRSVQPK
ncbi:unnamed protein product [marine sediment metagenome]|uniref:Uncharacterized protein n=1 Tax=marine sediment metagenome TaxID=412755 RepID=X1RJW0_9ZZZZ